MNVIWQPAALAQREGILRFIASDSLSAALKFDEEVENKCDRLALYPMSGRAGRVPSTRELIVHPNYVAVYRVAGDDIEILAFLHTAQRWP